MLSANLRSLPYLVHTNRELGLMLRGKKPVASFLVEDELAPLLRYLRMFDRHVELGRFTKRETLIERTGRQLRRVLYAVSGEEWRIEALLSHYDSPSGWSAESERREGLLFGYTAWEIEAWLEYLRQHGLLQVR